MNIGLLDPFQQTYPEIVEDYLTKGQAVKCEFNRKGNLLAAGLVDGKCVIWDFDTKGVARILKGHVKEITSLSWSRNSRKLLTSSLDHRCVYWDLMECKREKEIDFQSPVLLAALNPKNDLLFVACPLDEAPELVDLTTMTRNKLPISKELQGDTELCLKFTACFSMDGEYVFVGDSKGFINIIKVKMREIIQSFKASHQQIKSIVLSKNNIDFLVNANDRKIRLYHLSDITKPPELSHEFQDVVTNNQWMKCCFSRDGDFIVGGSAEKFAHKMYVWATQGGGLVKLLEPSKPNEGLLDLCWHPTRSVIASVMLYGRICVWVGNYHENWSAFAPDFKELEENVDYLEKEDEFDEATEDQHVKKTEESNEKESVDVVTIDADSDEEDNFFLPILSDNEDETVSSKDFTHPQQFTISEKRKGAGDDKHSKRQKIGKEKGRDPIDNERKENDHEPDNEPEEQDQDQDQSKANNDS